MKSWILILFINLLYKLFLLVYISFDRCYISIEDILEEKDRQIIKSIKIRGGEFPDIDNLMDRILDFLNFFNEFFLSFLFTVKKVYLKKK